MNIALKASERTMHAEQRNRNFASIRCDNVFDVIVVGGGINGIGVYRELALQGLRVLLVERRDFCSGCSAAPSRMIHGGLRYLENGELDLVRESLRERDALLRNAPHMVRPLPTTIPIDSYFSGMLNGIAGVFGLSSQPASRGAVPIKIGLALYDWITRRRRVLPPHVFRSAGATRTQWPQLTRNLRFSATYFDAWISYPERLGIELLLDTARHAAGSIALNYAGIARDGDAFVITESRTGERLPVTARAVVNATGAWLDEAVRQLAPEEATSEKFVSGTKGSHLILDNPALHDALGGHMIYFGNDDGRVCIVFPYLGRVLAGSTDIRVEKADRVRCEPEERDYILDALRLVFPGVAVSVDDVVFSYSGIRPLPKSDHEFTGRISRGHFVHRLADPVPQFCMVGGKWTTFRAFAEQTADIVLAELGHHRVRGTQELPIGGGERFPNSSAELEKQLTVRGAVDRRRAAHLVDHYGTRADEVLRFCRARQDDEPIATSSPVTTGEIAFLGRHEFVVELGDLLLRRTSLVITGAVSSTLARRVARTLAKELGWSAEHEEAQIQAFFDELEWYHGVSRETLEKRSEERIA